MNNYGERLVYWYLRLQGFLLIEDFVLHGARGRTQPDVLHSADADLLGIRLKDAQEEIDHVTLENDPSFAHILDLNDSHAAVIVQVKTGPEGDEGSAFDYNRVSYCIKRLGVPEPAVWREVLAREAVARRGEWTVAKLLVTERAGLQEPTASANRVSLGLGHVLGWIESRLEAHVDPKYADRMFFPDDLLQFLVWQARIRSGGSDNRP